MALPVRWAPGATLWLAAERPDRAPRRAWFVSFAGAGCARVVVEGDRRGGFRYAAVERLSPRRIEARR